MPSHTSLDIDGLDPSIAPATGTPARGGIDYREIHYILRRLASSMNLVSMDLVEINPDLEPDKKDRKKIYGDNPILEGTETVYLGGELILSALGQGFFDLNTDDN